MRYLIAAILLAIVPQALSAQELYLGEFNIRNDNAKDAAAGIQDVVSGWLIDGNSTLVETLDETTGQMVQATQYDFTPVAIFWIVASVISFLLPVFNWKYRK